MATSPWVKNALDHLLPVKELDSRAPATIDLSGLDLSAVSYTALSELWHDAFIAADRSLRDLYAAELDRRDDAVTFGDFSD